ncbi:MAG: thiamine-phosphate kinase [Actinomycetota bacterium]
MDLSEEELLEAIRRVLSGAGDEVRVGVGDDAAVLAPTGGELVITTDALVEDVHFVRGPTGARDLGHKAIAVNVSDIAAMGASPRAAVCALTLPPDVEAAWAMELFGGMREACDEYGLWLVGGDLSRGREVSIAVTVTGEVAPGRAVLRSGARAGDHVVVTGDLGGSSAGLRLTGLRTMPTEEQRALIRRHLRPIARLGEAGVLAGSGATAMMDISDGLALDLTRLCRASGVGATIAITTVPVAHLATLEDALGGGEDYELLATMPDEGSLEAARAELKEAFGVPLVAIGRIVEGAGVTAVDADGSERQLEPAGWDHFR